MVVFFCAFLALRSEDNKIPMERIEDFDIPREDELFAGSVSTSQCPPTPIQDLFYTDESLMIIMSMVSDCSGKDRPASSDSKLRYRPVKSKGKQSRSCRTHAM